MLADLEATLSQPRIAAYRQAAGYDEIRTLQLYRWNTQLGEAFHLPVQAVEIALRNRINTVLVARYNDDWWNDPRFFHDASLKQRAQIEEVKARIARRGAPVVTGQIVAGLSFGFWVSMLDARFNPALWSAQLTTVFPHLPNGTSRDAAQKLMRQIAEFRNRIWHHEPIFKDNTTLHYSNCMKALGWLCAHQKAWVKPQCTVMQVVRSRP